MNKKFIKNVFNEFNEIKINKKKDLIRHKIIEETNKWIENMNLRTAPMFRITIIAIIDDKY